VLGIQYSNSQPCNNDPILIQIVTANILSQVPYINFTIFDHIC